MQIFESSPMEGFKRRGRGTAFEWSHHAGLAQALLLFAAAQATQAEKEEIQHSEITWPSLPLSIAWTLKCHIFENTAWNTFLFE